MFAFAYSRIPDVMDSKGEPVQRFAEFLHYSFTTQATVGYGDLVPRGFARSIAALQAVVGMALNAVILGLTTYKVIKRTSPLTLPGVVIYNPNEHCFAFRFWNTDADDLREVAFTVTAFRATRGETYDIACSLIGMDYDIAKFVPSIRLFKVKTQPNKGVHSGEIGEHRGSTPLHPSPLHMLPGTTLRIDFTGYFQTTGDMFFMTKDYSFEKIRCGEYYDIDNDSLKNLSRYGRGRLIAAALQRTTSTTPAECEKCPFHKKCELDVAVRVKR